MALNVGPIKTFRRNWLLRYGLAVVVFGAVVGLSLLLSRNGIKINLTIPIILAMACTAWYGGLGPGLLLAVLFQAITIFYNPVPPDSTVAKAIFGHFSVFSLYVFLAYLVSRFKNIQTRLREQRDLLQVTLASIGDGVVTTDTSGIVTFINPVAERLTGWDKDEAVGRAIEHVVNLASEETGAVAESPIDKVLETGRTVGLANHTKLISKDGREIPIDDSAAPIKDRETVKGVVLVFSDVTERKLAERSRREKEMLESVIAAQEAERMRIARDLHDHLGQRMTALRLRLEGLSALCNGNEALRLEVEGVKASASRIDSDIGFLSWELRPTELEILGLADALKSYVREWSRQYGINAEFQACRKDGLAAAPRYPQAVETNLYRIVQEALNNVLKHAAADNVSVLLQERGDDIVLIVEDDGTGFNEDAANERALNSGLGILGMQERAAILKGSLEVESELDRGTTVVARIPLGSPGRTQAAAAEASGEPASAI